MTLAEIAEIVATARAKGLMALEHQTETGVLRVRLGSQHAQDPVPAKAPCAGVFLSAHPVQPHIVPPQTVATQGEVIAFLKIGPCLRAVQAPRPGILQRRAGENSLVGYGEVLFDIE